MLRLLMICAFTFCAVLTCVDLAPATTNHGISIQQHGFRNYPSFLRKRTIIEAKHDKGLTIEYIVRCTGGIGIMTFSKVEGLYCLPDHSCVSHLDTALRKLCR